MYEEILRTTAVAADCIRHAYPHGQIVLKISGWKPQLRLDGFQA